MVSIENKVFNDVSTALETAYPGISCYSDYIRTPESFPCVTIVESDNSVATRYITTSQIENATDVAYEVNIYSNKKGTAKSEAKTIAESVDGMFKLMGFVRTYMGKTPNIDDSVYRITLRYTGRVTSTTTTVGQVTTTKYKIYRKD